MKYIATAIILFSTITLVSCDSATLWSDGTYEVQWIDTNNNRIVSYILDDGNSIGRVGPTVIAVGSDTRYLVAKQRDRESDKTYYYYIDKSKDNKYLNMSDITKGPFSKEQYTNKAQKLSLPKFSEEF